MNFGEDLNLQAMLANKLYHQYIFRSIKEAEVQQHYRILLLLERSGGRISQKNICEHLYIEKTNMVAIIDMLEKKGYLKREVNYQDRRSKLIVATPKTKEVVEMVDDLFLSFEGQISDDLTWQEMHNCIRVLKKINNKLKDKIELQSKHSALKKIRT